MRNLKMYESDDKMISIIRDDYSVLQMLSSFGISMGFGDKTVREVCDQQGVDTYTFMTIVNFCANGHIATEAVERLSVPTLLRYLKASHVYFIEFEIPYIRKELMEALNENDNLASLILRLYDSYSSSIKAHMQHEERMLFPFVENMINGKVGNDSTLETFSKHHHQTNHKLKELKNIIIKYLPADHLSNNRLIATLYDIYNSERWLEQHVEIEDKIFIPAIRHLKEQIKQSGVTQKISTMIGSESQEAISEREKDVIICVVQGMANKEIADHLNISPNTVITHRRNIAKKLQIHTPAGLTIYAIVNNLVDISAVKL